MITFFFFNLVVEPPCQEAALMSQISNTGTCLNLWLNVLTCKLGLNWNHFSDMSMILHDPVLALDAHEKHICCCKAKKNKNKQDTSSCVFLVILRGSTAARAAWKRLIDPWRFSSSCRKEPWKSWCFPPGRLHPPLETRRLFLSLLKSWQWSRSQPEGLRANSIPELPAQTCSPRHISEEASVYICLRFPADLLTAFTMWPATERGGASAGSGRRWFS